MKIGTLLKLKEGAPRWCVSWAPAPRDNGTGVWLYADDVNVEDEFIVFLGHHEGDTLSKSVGCFLSASRGIIWLSKHNFMEVK
jgi:hypothetical protein